MTLTAGTDFRCDNPAAPTVCYAIGHPGVFESAQRAVNRMVGTVPGIAGVDVDGRIGPATAEAAARVASFLLGQVAHPGVGTYVATLTAVATGRREVLAANAVEFARVVDLYAAAKGLAPPRPRAAIVASLPAASATAAALPSSGRRALWWLAGALAVSGVGALGYSIYRRNR